MILSNARRNASPVSSTSIWRAVSMKRFDCSGSSGFGFISFGSAFGFSVMLPPDGSSISEPLADDTTKCAIGALYIVNAECDPLVVAEIESARYRFKCAR